MFFALSHFDIFVSTVMPRDSWISFLLLEVDELKKVEARSWSLWRILEMNLLWHNLSRLAYLLEGRLVVVMVE